MTEKGMLGLKYVQGTNQPPPSIFLVLLFPLKLVDGFCLLIHSAIVYKLLSLFPHHQSFILWTDIPDGIGLGRVQSPFGS